MILEKLKLNEHNRKWWILAAMASTISMIFIDITVLPVSLPTIQRQLDLNNLTLQWIVNAYTLALATFVLAGGRLGDMLGYRKLFRIGVFLFALTSALCGISFSGTSFIVSRFLQGIAGAILIPSTSAIIMNSFPANQRGKAMGIYISIGSIFLALGPLIGGLFSEFLSWRWIFWLNIPIACLGFFISLRSVPDFKPEKKQFDFFGFFTLSLGVSFITIALMQINAWGWNSPWTLTLLCLGILFIVGLMMWDRAVEEPYVDFSLFKKKHYVGALACIFTTQFFITVTIFWAIYFQNVLKFTPSEAGSFSLLANLPVVFISPFGGYLLDRFGPKIPVIIGYILSIIALIAFTLIMPTENVYLIVLTIIPFGCGIPLIFTPSITTAMHEIPPAKRGTASGISITIRQFGSTLGLALFGALFLQIQTSQFSSALFQNPKTYHFDPSDFEGLLSDAAPAVQAFNRLTTSTQNYVQTSFVDATNNAFFWINWGAVLFAVLGLISAIFLMKHYLSSENET